MQGSGAGRETIGPGLPAIADLWVARICVLDGASDAAARPVRATNRANRRIVVFIVGNLWDLDLGADSSTP